MRSGVEDGFIPLIAFVQDFVANTDFSRPWVAGGEMIAKMAAIPSTLMQAARNVQNLVVNTATDLVGGFVADLKNEVVTAVARLQAVQQQATVSAKTLSLCAVDG